MGIYSDSKVNGANKGPTWVLSAPDGSHVVPMDLAIRVHSLTPLRPPRVDTIDIALIASSWGQHGAHLGPTGPRWDPRWPHELCYLGGNLSRRPNRIQLSRVLGNRAIFIEQAWPFDFLGDVYPKAGPRSKSTPAYLIPIQNVPKEIKMYVHVLGVDRISITPFSHVWIVRDI